MDDEAREQLISAVKWTENRNSLPGKKSLHSPPLIFCARPANGTQIPFQSSGPRNWRILTARKTIKIPGKNAVQSAKRTLQWRVWPMPSVWHSINNRAIYHSPLSSASPGGWAGKAQQSCHCTQHILINLSIFKQHISAGKCFLFLRRSSVSTFSAVNSSKIYYWINFSAVLIKICNLKIFLRSWAGAGDSDLWLREGEKASRLIITLFSALLSSAFLHMQQIIQLERAIAH